MTAPEDRWYEAAFGAASLALYAHRDLAEARRQAAWLRGDARDGPAPDERVRASDAVLDLGCGRGRHLVALQERGVRAFGVDRSLDALAAVPPDVRSRAVRGDLRALPFADGAFDVALSLFSSFGYFGAEGDLAALREAARVLRPGGRLVLDLADPASVRDALVPRSERRVGGLLFQEERLLEDGGRVVVKRVRCRRVDVPGGGDAEPRESRWTERLRLYAPEELAALARGAGFTPRRRADGADPFAGLAPTWDAARRVHFWRAPGG